MVEFSPSMALPTIKRFPKSDRPASRELAASVSDSTTGLKTLVDRGSYRILRLQSTRSHYEIDATSPHVVSVQHAPNPKVNFRVGDDLFSGLWERGACCVWPGETPRALSLDQAIDVTAIWLSPNFCGRILETSRFDPRPIFNHRNVVSSQTLDLLASSAEAAGSYARLYQDALVTSLVAHLGDRHGAFATAARRGALPPARLRRVLDFIEDELHGEINLSKLSALAQVSESHFCTMFRISMGISPHAYVIEQRIERAKHMLRWDLSKNITEIAFSVGFKSSSHFSTIFFKKTGVAPLNYRNGH